MFLPVFYQNIRSHCSRPHPLPFGSVRAKNEVQFTVSISHLFEMFTCCSLNFKVSAWKDELRAKSCKRLATTKMLQVHNVKETGSVHEMENRIIMFFSGPRGDHEVKKVEQIRRGTWTVEYMSEKCMFNYK